MTAKLAVGGEFFDKIRESGAYYVDKTALIYRLANDKKNTVSLFTRPRRFGKTLTMTMLQSFFDIRRDSKSLFEGLQIAEYQAFCDAWMNQYPVLFLSLKDVDGYTFEDAYNNLKSTIATLFREHDYLLEDTALNPADRESFQTMMYKKGDRDDVTGALLLLTRMMRNHFKKPVILLIDEYDVPLAKAQERVGGTHDNDVTYYNQMVKTISSLMSKSLKTNDALQFAVITGCLKISKESIFTGVNHFASYSVLDKPFADSFGFTETEVAHMLHLFEMEEQQAVLKEWYDGYLFGDKAMYCPWDVLSYISDYLSDATVLPKNYWTLTSSNEIIRDFIHCETFDVQDRFETLMNGGAVETKTAENLTYNELYHSEENLWTVLLMTGYLTKTEQTDYDTLVKVRIPNREIMAIYENTIAAWFKDTVDKSARAGLFQALWNDEEEKATQLLSDFLFNTIIYHDYHEDFYHAFVTGLFVGGGYSVDSNRESGLGRTDIVIKDKKNRRAIVIEAKKADSAKQLGNECDRAIQQIRDKMYHVPLEQGYREVHCYGIAFFEKQCMVKKMYR